MDNKVNFAFNLLKQSIKTVPAYKKFLALNGFKPSAQLKKTQFSEIPISDKKIYLQKYGLLELLPKDRLPPQIYASSGSTGTPFFWFRSSEQEKTGALTHEFIFKKIFNIRPKDSTLVVICFSMGIWVAGGFTLACCNRLAEEKKFKLSVVTPGIDLKDILNIFRNLAPKFKNVILAGYPTFISDIISELNKNNIKFDSKIKILTAGEKFDETWRDGLLSNIRSSQAKNVINLYGSADAGLMGHETPLTTLLRRQALKSPIFYQKIFGQEQILPGLYQYHPQNIFFEEIKNELVLTAPTSIPLIRYNIHDTGKVIFNNELKKLLQTSGLWTKKIKKMVSLWNLPILIVKSRSDVTITFYALNIYPENILQGLQTKFFTAHITGRLLVFTKTLKNRANQQSLHITVEVKDKIKRTNKILSTVSKKILSTLLDNNAEFRKLHQTLGQNAEPKINLVAFNSKDFSFPKNRSLLLQLGKKPKLINN